MDLSAKANVTDASISRIERGRFIPSHRLLVRLADALDVGVDQLVKGKRRPLKPNPSPARSRLLAAVGSLDEGAVDDVTRAVKLLLEAGARSSGDIDRRG